MESIFQLSGYFDEEEQMFPNSNPSKAHKEFYKQNLYHIKTKKERKQYKKLLSDPIYGMSCVYMSFYKISKNNYYCKICFEQKFPRNQKFQNHQLHFIVKRDFQSKYEKYCNNKNHKISTINFAVNCEECIEIFDYNSKNLLKGRIECMTKRIRENRKMIPSHVLQLLSIKNYGEFYY